MIRVKSGSTYAEIVAAVKVTVNPVDLGAEVKQIKRSMEGYTIVEFSKMPKVQAAFRGSDLAVACRCKEGGHSEKGCTAEE